MRSDGSCIIRQVGARLKFAACILNFLCYDQTRNTERCVCPMSVRSKKRASKGSNILFVILILIILAVMGFCLYQLLPKFIDYRKSDNAYKDLTMDVVKDYSPNDDLKIVKLNKKTKSKKVKKVQHFEDALTIDWDAFAGTEIVAWFQMDDISYPVMQHSDNDYYLHRLPDGTYNGGGSLFLLSYNNPLFTDSSSFIYGHNMNNGSMFGKLKHYTGAESQDHIFYIYLPDGTRHAYQFFSVATVLQESKTYTWSFADDESFLNWQQWMLDESMIGTSLEKSVDAKFVTLSTCNGYAGTNHRLVVCGQEIRVDELQEPASWYETYMAKYNNKMAEKRERAEFIAKTLESLQQQRKSELHNTYYGL